MSEETRDKNHQKAIEFEKNHGPIVFLKMIISSLNRLLIEKGVVSKEELTNSFIRQIEEFEKKHQSQLLKMFESGRVNVDALEKAAGGELGNLKEIMGDTSIESSNQFKDKDQILKCGSNPKDKQKN